MHFKYAAAAAAAPLILASAAQAQVAISTTRTSPVVTSTVNGGAAADVTVTEDGSVELSSGTAITIDSNNSVVLEEGSTILMEEAADGATGVALEPGHTGDLTIGGAISITDSIDEYEDVDEDGDLDGPFADGRDRYGVHLDGDGTWTGDLTVEGAGSIHVEGEDSYGIALDGDLLGSLNVFGSVSVVGDGSTGVSITGDVVGDVVLSGSSISATGDGSVGVSVEGVVDGTLKIQSSITSNAYRYTYQPTSLSDLDEEDAAEIDLADDTLFLEDLDPDDMLLAGSALQVSNDVTGGILLDSFDSYRLGEDGDDDGDGVTNGDEDFDGDGVINSEDEDRDGDGILDADEGTASLTTYGSAPALAIGAPTEDVTIGVVGSDDPYGLVNEGAISAVGVYDGVSATAVLIGGGTGSTVISGGIRNQGSISASAAEGDAVGLWLASGAYANTLVNDGSISVSSATEGEDAAIALLVDSDASLTSISNSGNLSARIHGEDADAVAIRDESGTVGSLTNTGSILAAIYATDDDDDDETDDETITGDALAIDFSANTTGVVIEQFGQSDSSWSDSDGDEIYDDEDDDDDDDGIPDLEDDDDNDDDNDGVYDADEPYIAGDIVLGSGADSIDLQNGLIAGDVEFGEGRDAFTIGGGATYVGALSDTDGQLDIAVEDGTLDARQAASIEVSSLSVAEDGELVISIDPAAGTVGGFDVSGAATFADGATLSLHLNSLVDDAGERVTLVTAGSLQYGDVLGSGLTGSSPYMVVAEFGTDQAEGSVYVDLRKRTTTEMALSGVETAAYDAFYNALSRDEDVMDAFLDQATREDFINLYEQTLPDHSGGTLATLAAGIDLVNRALSERNDAVAPGEVSGWVQEINFYQDKDKTDTYGYRAEGIGVAGGVERMTGAGAFGVSAALATADITDPESEAEEVLSATLLEMGLYWRAQGRGWTTWARAAAGYARFSSVRTLVGDDIYLSNEAEWDGYSLTGAAGLSYERSFGRLSLRPMAYVDWFSLSESSRRESGGGDAFDLEVDGRDGSVASATAALRIAYAFGEDRSLRPELKLGWREVFHADYGETVARYLSGGTDFMLTGEPEIGGGPFLGLGFTIGNDLGRLSIGGDAQILDDDVRYGFALRATAAF